MPPPDGNKKLQEMDLYAAGDFKAAGGEKAGGIAVWLVRERVWRRMGSLNGAVYALASLDGWLYAGGDFHVAGGSRDGSSVASDHIARFRHGVWHTVVGGAGGPVYTLSTAAGCVYAGGRFDRVCVSEGQAAALVANELLPEGTRRAARCKDEVWERLYSPARNAARLCPSSSSSSSSSTSSHGEEWEALEQATDYEMGTVRAMAVLT